MLSPAWIELRNAEDASLFGTKAATLAGLIRAGFTVSAGRVCAWPDVHRGAQSKPELEDLLRDLASEQLIVRSSAVGEDAVGRSYAGQFHSQSVSADLESLTRAIERVVDSASACHLEAYARATGAAWPVRMAVLVQQYVSTQLGGVIFSQEPYAAHRIMIEMSDAAERVVRGQGINRAISLDRKEYQIQLKSLLLSGSEKAAVQRLVPLALEIEAQLGYPADIEWGMTSERLVIFQCREAKVK